MEKNTKYTKRIVKEENVINLGRFNIHLQKIEYQGKTYDYSYASVKKGVCMLVKVDEKYCVLKQYRRNFNRNMYEFPAGAIDKDEEPEVAARREVLEETGYVAESVIPLGSIITSPGLLDEEVFLFAVVCKTRINNIMDPLEEIISELYTFEQVEAMCKDRIITMGSSLLCWNRYKDYLEDFI